MDTFRPPEAGPQRIEFFRQLIKNHMPETYKAIQTRAADSDLGRDAFALVTRGLKGEPNCFYAIERGHVVGTPFDMPDVSSELARTIVQFGCQFLIMWAPKGGEHGAH
jgi:hypothetical protein